MKVLSLFNGRGTGFLASRLAWIKIDAYYSSEVDKYANSVASYEFPDTIQMGDVKKIEYFGYPKPHFNHEGGVKPVGGGIDLLIGWSPCTNFSLAGDRSGMICDSLEEYRTLKAEKYDFWTNQSYLFWEFVRLLEETQPKWFMLENVSGIKDRERDIISRTLWVEPILINSCLMGAQNRKRLFWTNIPNITRPEDKKIMLKDILEDIPLSDPRWKSLDEKFIPTVERRLKEKKTILCNVNPSWKWMNGNLHSCENLCPTLTTNKWEGMKILGIFQIPRWANKGGIVQGWEKTPCITSSQWQENNFLIGRFRGSQNLRIHANQGKCQTLTALMGTWGGNVPVLLTQYMFRKITITECNRLMNHRDEYGRKGVDEKGKEVDISASQWYKMTGNGWDAAVIAHIFSFIPA